MIDPMAKIMLVYLKPDPNYKMSGVRVKIKYKEIIKL